MSSISIIHKYGLYYCMSLYVVLLTYSDIHINQINFWLMLFCFCLNMYFFFHRGMVYAITKNEDFDQIKKEVIKKMAEKTMRQIEKDEEDENKLN